MTFTKLFAPYDDKIIVYPQYCMYVADLTVAQDKLHAKFAEHGVDYDASDNRIRQLCRRLPKDHVGTLRTKTNAQNKQEKDKKAWRNVLEVLIEMRRDFLAELHKDIEEMGGADGSPDFVIGHIAACPIPRLMEERNYFHYRGGRKVYHRCSAVIVELKAPPCRHSWDARIGTRANLRGGSEVGVALKQAEDELMEYCAVHFSEDPAAKSVIALAGAGPCWRWASIEREDVPDYDWILREPIVGNPDSLDKELAFHEKFQAPPDTKPYAFILGTPESDIQLNKIRKEVCIMIRVSGHTPSAPVFEDD
ncbi:hypothetical protein H0H81_001090 [Sphagnurus paluster]|uniref:Uncharacterized protein n=1 Tax=Sphagnurus paluster TaxID=117069 RepID=A0A9P7K2V9_9AGAR|nr:hypothetical protein H0H81_001090 [Sphagnurus paluster]